eukprot:gene25659-11323_t
MSASTSVARMLRGIQPLLRASGAHQMTQETRQCLALNPLQIDRNRTPSSSTYAHGWGLSASSALRSYSTGTREVFDSNKDLADDSIAASTHASTVEARKQENEAASNGCMMQDLKGCTILKLKGLPLSSLNEDVVRWFDDPALGIAPISADRYDLEEAMGFSTSANNMDLVSSTILKLRGIPFTSTEEDVASWFNDPALGIAPISPDSVFIEYKGHRRPSGSAFVEFPTTQEAAKARAKNLQMMGSRYIEIFPADRYDLEKAMGFSTSANNMDLVGSTILKLRGMPFTSTEEDVASWLDDPALGIAPISPDR